ncbi:GCN5-related N-acetyltransferase [Methanococcus vannielii SB]|jgi:putative beta-lysine N-acetyltransferase|uniref:GCN5-related N-acetyltransferase n=1 Tax=Methanococcus vannielii (strain ATCC 35089 / DSM 1224 / JCM 13029 / OCM 148 / SB) TaxID=406327 RepID=A6URJ8_METVS|nr:putative beta-lysine N-acetyltransferase [Methanococcus vannielii]ABR55120.1 GCN5-related N-acetyltransferase [Methanococcus vannielii SB]
MEEIVKINDSIVQISELSDRIYVMKFGRNSILETLEEIEKIALKKKLSKIFLKIHEHDKKIFEKNGYIIEGLIENYFLDGSAYFMSKFFNESRKVPNFSKETKNVLNYVKSISKVSNIPINKKYGVRIANKNDSVNLAKHYSKVFETYPFPIDNPNYIRETIQSANVKYFIIEDSGKIIAASSCEMDNENKCVEMTDFAVLFENRKEGLSSYLLHIMEKVMSDNGFRVFYTISRSISHGMNITFKKRGYIYGGTAINNTNICGNLENMNFWYKVIQ